MQSKTLFILSGILVLLFVILGVKTYLPKLSSPTSPYMEKIKSQNKETIHSIVIKNSSGSIELKKEGDKWVLNGKKVDFAKVSNLVNLLFPSTPPEIIAQTDKRHKSFELTDDTATKVILDDKLVFLIGKGNGSYVYARFENENNVYLLESTLTNFSTQASDWFDKTILSFDQTKASKLTFRKAKDTFVLVKKEDKWLNERNDKEVKREKVDSILSQISNLSALSLYDSKEGSIYKSLPELTFEVEYDGKSETLEFFKGSSDYLVKRLSDGEKFVIGEYTVSSLTSDLKEID